MLNQRFKTTLYKDCPLGQSCHYAHGSQELRSPLPDQARYQNTKPKPYSNFKSILCSYFEKGLCKNGSNCTYAHGVNELNVGGTQLPSQTNYTQFLPKGQIIEDQAILTRQLEFITNKLKELHPQNQFVIDKIEEIQQNLSKGENSLAGNNIHLILTDNEIIQNSANEHLQIVSEAREYGQKLFSQNLQSNFHPIQNYEQTSYQQPQIQYYNPQTQYYYPPQINQFQAQPNQQQIQYPIQFTQQQYQYPPVYQDFNKDQQLITKKFFICLLVYRQLFIKFIF